MSVSDGSTSGAEGAPSEQDALFDSIIAADGQDAAPATELDSAFDDIISGARDAEKLHTSLLTAITRDPVDETQRQRLARKLGVSPELLPETKAAQATVDRDALDPITLKVNSPSTAKWLEAQANANVAGMEHKSLSALEESGRSLARDIVAESKNIAGSAAAAIPAINAAAWGLAQAASDVLLPFKNPVTDFFTERRKGQEAIAKALRPDTTGMGHIRKGVYAGVESAAMTAVTFPFAAARLAVGGAKARIEAAKLITGSLSAVTAGQSYGEAKDAGIGTGQALTYAASQAAIEYWTESASTGALLGTLTGKTGLMKGAVDFLKKEVWGEQVATAFQDLNSWATLNPDAPFSEYLAARPGAALETLSATVVGGAIQVGGARAVSGLAPRADPVDDILPPRRERADTAMSSKAVSDYGTLKAFVEQAANNPLQAYNKEAFHDFVSNMSEDGAAPEVLFVDHDTLVGILAQEKIDPSVVMPEVAAQIASAKEIDSEIKLDVRVNFADLATHLASAAGIDTLLQNAKLDPQGMSYVESVSHTKTLATEMAEQAKAEQGTRLNKDGPPKKKRDTPEPVLTREEFTTQQLAEDIQKEESGSTKTGAAAVTAELAGENLAPTAAAPSDRRGSEETVALREAIDALPPEERDIRIRALREDTAKLDGAGKDAAIRELRRQVMLDTMTGIGSLTAYRDMVESGKNPIHGSIDANGLKWVNDNMGMPGGDAMLIAIGQALMKVTDKAYRTGGDEYIVLGATEQEVSGIMEKVRDVLKAAKITATKPDGTTITKVGVEVSHGTGPDKASADAKLKRDKEQRIAAGTETARGAQPPGVAAVTRTGEPYTFGKAPGRTYESYLATHGNTRGAFLASVEDVRKKLLAQLGVGSKKKVLTKAEFEAQKANPKVRRTDPTFRAAIDNMPERDRAAAVRLLHGTPEGMTEGEKDSIILELRRTLLVDPLTGIGSFAAYRDMVASGERPFHASIDGNGLKWVNDNMSMASGDQLLTEIGRAIKRVTNYGYRTGGDEYIILGASLEEVDANIAAVNALLSQAKIVAEKADGTIFEKTGVEISTGTGADKDAAEAKMKADKNTRILAGKETPRGGEPPGVVKQYNQASYEAYLESEGVARGSRFSDPVNRANVEPVVAFYATQAKRLGISAAELYDKYPLKLRAADGPGGTVAGYFTPDKLMITLLKGADLSTFIHESGHFYLHMLADLASQENAPKEIIDDMNKTLAWFGVKDLDTWRGMATAGQRQYHEQWAESFERWTVEGVAPTVGMQPLFSRFRSWMTSVYKSAEGLLQHRPLAGKLDDEIRFVFGRLIAAENEILVTEQARAYVAMDLPKGVSASEYEKYKGLADAATQAGVEDMQERSLRVTKWMSGARNRAMRRLQGEAKEARDAIKAQVAKEVNAEPINVARKWLKTGEMLDGEGNEVKALKGFKLDSAVIKEMYPESALERPDTTKLRGLKGPDGLHPDLVAQMFGFSSGDALVRELITGEDPKAKIEGVTDQRMLEQHGELVDQDGIEAAANAAIHNESRARMMAAGLRMLTHSTIPVGQIVRAAKEAAKNTIGALRVRDIYPKAYEATEQRANKAVLAKAAKDPAAAVSAQRSALVNNALAKEAVETLEEVDAAVKYLGKFDNEGTRKALSFEYLEQIDDLRANINLRKDESLRSIDKKQTLVQFIEQQQALGFEPIIDPDVLAEAMRKHYKDMTVTELRDLVDAVKHIEHLGRLEKTLLTAKDAREFAERMAEANESIRANANRTVEERSAPVNLGERLGKMGRQFSAMHRKFSSYIREMDGGKDNGTMYKLLLDPMNEGGDSETQLRAQIGEKMVELFTPIMGGIKSTRRSVVPGTKLSLTPMQRIMFAMNMGNAGNKQRLLDGGVAGHRRAITENDAQKVVDSLTKTEMDFVQGVWDYIATFRPQIEALEKQLTGKIPKWVEPTPVNTPHGVYRGGYLPAKYDADLSTASEAMEAFSDIRTAMRGIFGSSTTKHGYVKDRAKAVKERPMLLDFSVIARHLNEVSHRLAWQPFLLDASRTLAALDAPIREHYGVENLREMKILLDDIAAGGTPSNSILERVLVHLRTGSTIVGIGWRVTTALIQPSGLAQSWERVGGVWIAKGLKQYGANPLATTELVREKSRFMRYRSTTMQSALHDFFSSIQVGARISAIQGSYFYLIHKMQATVDIPTWLGAYEKAAAELGLEAAANDEQRADIDRQAILLADQAVRDSQGSGQLKDLSRVERGVAGKLFTNFYSYFNVLYQRNAELYRRTKFKDPMSFGLFVADAVILNMLPVLFSVALKELLKGSCEDWECIVKKLGTEQLGYLMGQMILLRDIAPAVNAALGGESNPYSGPVSLRLFNDLNKLGKETGQIWAEGTDGVDLKFAQSLINVGGLALHYPAGQINATIDGIVAIERGDVEGVGVLTALMAGPPKN